MIKLPIIEHVKRAKGFKVRRSRNAKVPLGVFAGGVIVVFLLLIGRLFELTVSKGEYFRRLSDENRIREIIIEPKRGSIADRKGRIIVENQKADKKTKGRVVSRRIYNDPETFAHITGYRQLADKHDLENDGCLEKAVLGDRVGKKSVEKLFECELRGKKGKKLIELDARDKQYRVLSMIPPEDGKKITLSIDYDLQKKAYDLMNPQDGSKKGAIIALSPKTGEVLALLSIPSYNVQDFEDAKADVVKKYFSDKTHPLFNRVTEGLYPPGSIFKPFVAIAALEDKKIGPQTVIEDTGTIQAGPQTFGNWYFLEYGKKEGPLDLVAAIRRSNDIYFYRVGERLGAKRIKYWASKFGFGERINLAIDQSEGTIPSPFWKKEAFSEDWYLGDTYNMSIGQGYLLITPFQMALATASFANGGLLCSPQLIKNAHPYCKSLGISSASLNVVREGMRQACSPGGTGWPLFNFKVQKAKIKDMTLIQTGCKTGTAESHSAESKTPHAWFTVFAPYENPEIVLVVLVENGGQGSEVAAPIARDLLRLYFEGKYK